MNIITNLVKLTFYWNFYCSGILGKNTKYFMKLICDIHIQLAINKCKFTKLFFKKNNNILIFNIKII